MKFSVAALLAIPALTSAFAPVQNTNGARLAHSSSQLGMSATAVVTGPKGKAASSREEDMALTLQIILDHEARSATVSKDQLLSQTEEIAAIEEEEIDISIPYDAPAQLAYESSDKSMDYEAFKAKYEADAVELVKSKQPIDISIPYDAAAKLAYEATDKSVAYDTFKDVYEAEAVALVKSKQPIDISIPYDAAAKLAYESSDKSVAYADFKAQYEADAVALVVSKQPKKEGAAKAEESAAAPADSSDISIDYDAAAKLAYEASDKSMSFADFKPTYEEEAVALVVSKKPVDISINYNSAAQLAFLSSDRSMPYADFEKKYLADAVELVKSKSK